MHPYLRYASASMPEITRLICDLVECESPSESAADVNRFVDLLLAETSDIAKAETIAVPGQGKHVRLEFHTNGSVASTQILGLGHSDTVWPLGTLKQMPFRQTKERLWGPGVLDMKAGLAFFIFAVRTLIALEIPLHRRIVLLVVSDEEIGSPTSRAITEAEARQSELVLVVEPGTGLTGKLKTARKGIANYRMTIEGKASHAGVDFEGGASAVVEAAQQVGKIAALTDLQRGITVNPGVIRGGTKSNVVAAEACLDIDARLPRMIDAEILDQQLRAFRPIDPRCRLRVEGGLNRPPMQRTDAIAALFLKATQIGAELGVAVEESTTGGGSDGNFTAAIGIPTLDGLGAVGEGAHASDESIVLNRIPDRVALLAGLLASN